jgi:hypothetical protein
MTRAHHETEDGTQEPARARFMPGPWEWWTSNSWRRLISRQGSKTANVLCPIVTPDGHPDCVVSKADMALIAAAPDLYEALKYVIRAWADPGPMGSMVEMPRAVSYARDVLAKAGREP